MAGGYAAPPPGELGTLIGELRDLRKRVAELERPTGTQALESVALLQQLRTYTAVGGTANRNGPGLTQYTGLPTIEFDVDREMVVLMQISAPYNASYPAGVQADIKVEYEIVGPFATASLQAYSAFRSGDYVVTTTAIAATGAGFVGAGSHVFQPKLANCYTALGGGTAGLDFLNGQPVTVTLSVLGAQ